MSAGFEIYDGNGTKTLDLSNNLCRFVGAFSPTTYTGSKTISLGIGERLFAYLYCDYDEPVAATYAYADGATIKWNVNNDANKVHLRVYGREKVDSLKDVHIVYGVY